MKRLVPRDRLLVFEVKDGWEPLCAFLGCEIPKNMPFPHLNAGGATLKTKLNEDFRPYAILGACNPPLAHKALSTDPTVGLVLPCNVTVEATEDGGSLVRIADPQVILGVGPFSQNPTILEVANDAQTRLVRVAQALTA